MFSKSAFPTNSKGQRLGDGAFRAIAILNLAILLSLLLVLNTLAPTAIATLLPLVIFAAVLPVATFVVAVALNRPVKS